MTKAKKNKFLISFSPVQWNMLTALMQKYGQTSRSALFAMLMANDMNKRSAGRPRSEPEVEADDIEFEPDFSQDLPKKILWAGRMIGKREMKYLQEKTDNFPQAV